MSSLTRIKTSCDQAPMQLLHIDKNGCRSLNLDQCLVELIIVTVLFLRSNFEFLSVTVSSIYSLDGSSDICISQIEAKLVQFESDQVAELCNIMLLVLSALTLMLIFRLPWWKHSRTEGGNTLPINLTLRKQNEASFVFVSYHHYMFKKEIHVQ